MNNQVYKDMAWGMARELGGLLKKPITENTQPMIEGIIETVGLHYAREYDISFALKLLSLVDIFCDAQKNMVDICWLTPQQAYDRNILDSEEAEEYGVFLKVNKFKTEEEDY